MRIVLVDDDLSVRSSLEFALGLQGFQVRSYASAEALIAQSGLVDADCLVVDYRLPGMDGVALMTNLRARHIDIPAILITSNPSRSVVWFATELGARLVEKPLLDEELADTIRYLTRRTRPSRRLE